MKKLIVLSLFLVSQAVLAKGGFTAQAQHYLKTGEILKLTFVSDLSKEWLMESLREINSSPTLVEEARNLVEAEHGAEKLPYLEHMLKAQEVADTLGIELDIHVLTIAQMINYQTASKKDVEDARDEVIRHQTRSVTDKDRFKAFD